MFIVPVWWFSIGFRPLITLHHLEHTQRIIKINKYIYIYFREKRKPRKRMIAFSVNFAWIKNEWIKSFELYMWFSYNGESIYPFKKIKKCVVWLLFSQIRVIKMEWDLSLGWGRVRWIKMEELGGRWKPRASPPFIFNNEVSVILDSGVLCSARNVFLNFIFPKITTFW